MTGHAEFWRLIFEDGNLAIVMESDTVFREESIVKLGYF